MFRRGFFLYNEKYKVVNLSNNDWTERLYYTYGMYYRSGLFSVCLHGGRKKYHKKKLVYFFVIRNLFYLCRNKN
jgi:hypothetical protein